jgi:hypothetical protein
MIHDRIPITLRLSHALYSRLRAVVRAGEAETLRVLIEGALLRDLARRDRRRGIALAGYENKLRVGRPKKSDPAA